MARRTPEEWVEELSQQWSDHWDRTQRLSPSGMRPLHKLCAAILMFLQEAKAEFGSSPEHFAIMFAAIKRANTHSYVMIDKAFAELAKDPKKLERKRYFRFWIAGSVVWLFAVYGWFSVFGHRNYNADDGWLIALIPPGLVALAWALFGWARRT